MVIFVIAILGPTQVARGDERLKLISADMLENISRDGRTIQILSGNVVLRKGEMELRTSQARFIKADGRTHLTGEVIMLRPGEKLTCDSLTFYSSEDRIHAWGNVTFVQEKQTVRSEEFVYWTKRDSAIARHEVVMTQDTRRLTAREFRTQQTDGPRGASFEAFGAVVIEEGGRLISGEIMHYDDIEEILRLAGDARVQEGTRDLRGERIRLVYQDEIIDKAYVEQGAEATASITAKLSAEAIDTRIFTDLLSARIIEATFVDEKLSRLDLQGMASSIYHVVEDTVLQGVNSATGDTISLAFDDQSVLDRITVRGGARGRFEPEAGNASVDTVIDYRAEFIDYDIPAEITYMDQGAQVDYRENGLSAGSMKLTWQNNLLRAERAYSELPTLHQAGRDPMVGEYMEFDLISEKGRVIQGRTKLDNGYYHGDLVHRHPGDVFYVEHSKYTTCSLDDPHFYFASSRMKMLQGDKVIAKPIILYLADVPLFGLPFAVFPNKAGGRRSGLIMPGYGESHNHGQYMDGLGYFWAASDYADATTLLDFYDRRGVLVKGQVRYNKRYRFSGNLRSSYNRDIIRKEIAHLFSDSTSIRWDLRWNHRQTIDPTQRLNVDATYTSNPRMYRDLGKTLATRQRQQVVSNASYAKNWRGSGASFKLALHERYNLLAEDKVDSRVDTAGQFINELYEPPRSYGQKMEEKTRTLPHVSLSLNQRALIQTRKGQKPRWYNNINYSFSSNLNNRQSVFWQADSVTVDSLFWPDEKTVLNKTSARNNINLNSQQNLFKYLSTTIGIGIVQAWSPSYRRAKLDSNNVFRLDDQGAIKFDEIQRVTPRHTGQLSLSAQTNVYGLLPLRIGSLRAIRHIIKPSITYSYSPDFSKPIFGWDPHYFREDSQGKLFDKYQGSTIGGTPASEQQAISLSLSNRFQAKREVDNKEVKMDLLDWGVSTAYNFTADSLNLAPIRSKFRSPFLQKLKVDISMVHDIYAWDQVAKRKINRVLPFPRLTSMSVSSSLRFSGTRFVPLSEDFVEDTTTAGDTLGVEDEGQLSLKREVLKPKVSAGKLWNASFSLRYQLRPSLDPKKRETFWMGGNVKTSIGPGWKLGYSARFNMLTQELVHHDLHLYRELHCWEFAFSWTPSGPGRGFLLRINVRDADLQDIKYESRGGTQNLMGGLR